MNKRAVGVLVLAAALGACGRPDASGIYLYKADRQLALIELTQARDGAVTGRLDRMSIGPGGVIDDQSSRLDGETVRRDLVFAHGGVTAPELGPGLTARRSSPGAYQKAVSQLQSIAAGERRRTAEVQDRRAEAAARAMNLDGGSGSAAKLAQAAAELGGDAAKLDDGVAAAPDFARQSADNTARIAEMTRQASGLSGPDRVRLLASANQLIVGTNQLDMARTRYAVGLNQIVQSAAPVALTVERFCSSALAARLKPSCDQADAAAIDFESALVHASTVFKAYKQAVRSELSAQTGMASRLGG